MNRREFLERMFAAGLVVAAPKIIFDLAANTYKQKDMFSEWQWVNPYPHKPTDRVGFFYSASEMGMDHDFGPSVAIIGVKDLKRFNEKLQQMRL